MPIPPTTPADFNFTNWLEFIGASQPAGAQIFSETQQSAALVAKLSKPEQKISFLRRVRGYSYVDDTSITPYRLLRVNPMQHPEYGLRHLRATRVAFLDSHPAGNPENSADHFKPYREVTDDYIAVDRWAYYAISKATIDFTALPYPIIEDEDFGELWYQYEWQRNVNFFSQTATETSIISAETNQAVKFIEGTTNNPKGKPIVGEIGEYVPKSTLTWTWYNVPHEYLFDPTTGIPTKILNSLGKVNHDTFNGFPKMTLLLNGVVFEPFLNPWQWENYRPSFSYNVTFVNSFFDPLPAVPSPIFRGHNLLPWSKGGTSNGSIWYSCSRPANGGLTNPYLPVVDYGELFTHVLAPPATTIPPFPSYPP